MEPAAGGGQPQARRRPSGPALAGLLALLCSSLLLNALLLAHHFLSPSSGSCGLSWALHAAREAEAVAAVDCSGHGQVFLDGVTAGEDGRPGCECNACFGGPDCSLRTPNCTADADSGNPLFLEPYWRRHAAACGGQRRGGLRVAPPQLRHHRRHDPVRGARGPDPAPAQGRRQRRRRRQARRLRHRLHAAHQRAGVRAIPGRPRRLATVRHCRHRAVLPDVQGADGDVRRPRVQVGRNHGPMGQRVRQLHRRLHRVRHVAQQSGRPALQARARRLGGGHRRPRLLLAALHAHPGAGQRGHHDVHRVQALRARRRQTRLGADQGRERGQEGVRLHAGQRLLGIVKAILANMDDGEDDDIFAFGHGVMRARWSRLNAVVSRSQRISLQKISPGYCTYFKRITEPSPAYAWVRCEREEDEDCHDALLKANIITRSGVVSEASSRYTRISLLKSDDEFEVLMERVTDLVDAENYDGPGSSSI